jgi:hypothetical protein
MNWGQVLGLTVVGALVTTGGTLLGLFLKEVLLARSFERWKARQSLEQVFRKYCEPMALAAIELCNRLTLICDDFPPDFLESRLLTSTPEEPATNSASDSHFKRYRLISSVYRFCSFLGWVELYRQDTTFLDPQIDSGERRVDRALYAIRSDIADGQLNAAEDWQTWYDELLFREEQRAIGESMVIGEGAVRTIMGYAEFCDLFPGQGGTSREKWLLTASTFLLDAKRKDFREFRMRRLIVHLVELVAVLSKTRLREEHWQAHAKYKNMMAPYSTAAAAGVSLPGRHGRDFPL